MDFRDGLADDRLAEYEVRRCAVDRLGHDLLATIVLPTNPANARKLPILPIDCPHIAHYPQVAQVATSAE